MWSGQAKFKVTRPGGFNLSSPPKPTISSSSASCWFDNVVEKSHIKRVV